MEEDIRNRLKRVAAALESHDWPWAVAELRDLEYCATPRELTEDPETALIIAGGAWLGPWEALVEIQILFYDGEDDAFLKMDTERVPTVISNKLFEAALCRLREAEDAGTWSDVIRYATLLFQLPGACDDREQALLDLFAGVFDRVNAAARRNRKDKPRTAFPHKEAFTSVWTVLGFAAQSAGYDVTTSLLIGLLRGAEPPILRECSEANVVLLWEDLIRVWELRHKHGFSNQTVGWLHRVVSQDEPDEHAPTEMEEP